MSKNKIYGRKLRKNMALLCGVASLFGGGSAFAKDEVNTKITTSTRERIGIQKNKGGVSDFIKDNAIPISIAGAILTAGGVMIYNNSKNKDAKNNNLQQQSNNPAATQVQEVQSGSGPLVNSMTNQSNVPTPVPTPFPVQNKVGNQLDNPVLMQSEQIQSNLVHQTNKSDNSVLVQNQDQDQQQVGEKSEEEKTILDKISVKTSVADKFVELMANKIDDLPSKNLQKRYKNVLNRLKIEILTSENLSIKDIRTYSVMDGKATLYFFLVNSNSENDFKELDDKVEGSKYFGVINRTYEKSKIIYCVGYSGRPFKNKIASWIKYGTDLMETNDFKIKASQVQNSYLFNLQD